MSPLNRFESKRALKWCSILVSILSIFWLLSAQFGIWTQDDVSTMFVCASLFWMALLIGLIAYMMDVVCSEFIWGDIIFAFIALSSSCLRFLSSLRFSFICIVHLFVFVNVALALFAAVVWIRKRGAC